MPALAIPFLHRTHKVLHIRISHQHNRVSSLSQSSPVHTILERQREAFTVAAFAAKIRLEAKRDLQIESPVIAGAAEGRLCERIGLAEQGRPEIADGCREIHVVKEVADHHAKGE